MSEASGEPAAQAASATVDSAGFVFVTVLLDMMALGIVFTLAWSVGGGMPMVLSGAPFLPAAEMLILAAHWRQHGDLLTLDELLHPSARVLTEVPLGQSLSSSPVSPRLEKTKQLYS